MAVLLTIVLSALAVHDVWNIGLLPIPLADRAALTGLVHTATGPDKKNNNGGGRFERIALSRSDARGLTGTDITWCLLLALHNIPKGSLVITSENVITADDARGHRILCRMARAEVVWLDQVKIGKQNAWRVFRQAGDTQRYPIGVCQTYPVDQATEARWIGA